MDTDNALIFLFACYIVSIIFLSVAGILNPVFVIRLMVRQAKVRNGLLGLRRQMLIIGIFAELVIFTAIASLTARFFISDPAILRYIIPSVIVLFSVFVLGIVVLFIQVYNQNYSERSKEIHDLLAEVEEEARKKVLRELRIRGKGKDAKIV